MTTANGQTYNKAGTGKGVSGPDGRSAGERTSISNTSGPNGSGASISHGGFASGPGGTVAGGKSASTGPNGSEASRWGLASGPNGVAAGRSGVAVGPNGGVVAGREGAAVGPNGAVAGRSGVAVGPNGGVVAGREGVAVGPNGAVAGRSGVAVGTNGGVVAGRAGVAVGTGGTYYRSTTAIRSQGVYVRSACTPYYGCFNSGWYARYPGAWYAAAWGTAAAWQAASWSVLASTGGYPAQPVAYDYGSTVVYQDNSVYVNGDNVGTTADYSQQATDIAQTGKTADAAPDGNWTPLGVFAMVRGEEQTSDNVFQLAVNNDGILRGNYYNALTDTTETVYGAVDKKTQRAAWTVGDKKTPVYDAGIANLTEDQATMMVHYSNDREQQFTLFRIEQPNDQNAQQQPAADAGDGQPAPADAPADQPPAAGVNQ